MTDALRATEADALAAVAAAESTRRLSEVDTEFLGRKAGRLTGLLRGIGSLPADQKPLFGQALNDARARVEAALAARRTALEAAERAAREAAEAIDVTVPGRSRTPGKLHPLTRTFDDVKRVFIGLGFEFVDGPDIEAYLYNFDWLNYPPEHPALDEQMSFVIDDDHLMRTHTTPAQGRAMGAGRTPPFRIASCGRCFRRDQLDDTHSHTFHQVDGFAVDADLSLADLKGVLAEISRGLFGPEVIVRFRPDFFPFVEPGVEVAIRWGERWLELGGAGMIHPNILRRAGYDPEEVTGWAFGLGVDRMPMIRYGIDRLPLLLESDLRFLAPF